MKRTIRRTYSVHYKMHSADDVKNVCIIASDKWDAYDRARWEVIPEKEGCEPYSAWVDNYTTQAGREVKIKNAFEGNPVGDC